MTATTVILLTFLSKIRFLAFNQLGIDFQLVGDVLSISRN